jgi:hypothetical protein
MLFCVFLAELCWQEREQYFWFFRAGRNSELQTEQVNMANPPHHIKEGTL